MSQHARWGTDRRDYTFRRGIESPVPVRPMSQRHRSAQLDLEEGEILESHSSPGSSNSRSGNSERSTRYSGASREPPCHLEGYRTQAGSPRNSEARSWNSWDSRGSYASHEAFTGQDTYNTSRRRQHDSSASDQRRSRSRSPSRRCDWNANVFSRTGSVLAGPDDDPYPTRASSLDETPPYLNVERGPPEDCQCPVSWRCRHRPGQIPDCRPLVPKFKAWTKNKILESEIM